MTSRGRGRFCGSVALRIHERGTGSEFRECHREHKGRLTNGCGIKKIAIGRSLNRAQLLHGREGPPVIVAPTPLNARPAILRSGPFVHDLLHINEAGNPAIGERDPLPHLEDPVVSSAESSTPFTRLVVASR